MRTIWKLLSKYSPRSPPVSSCAAAQFRTRVPTEQLGVGKRVLCRNKISQNFSFTEQPPTLCCTLLGDNVKGQAQLDTGTLLWWSETLELWFDFLSIIHQLFWLATNNKNQMIKLNFDFYIDHLVWIGNNSVLYLPMIRIVCSEEVNVKLSLTPQVSMWSQMAEEALSRKIRLLMQIWKFIVSEAVRRQMRFRLPPPPRLACHH